MRIYFYHTMPVREAYNEWLEKKHPGHLLYGLTHFDQNGIDCIFHEYKKEKNRFGSMCRNLFRILFSKESFDVLYGTSFRGLELIIFLRALGLYRKPIAIWHHTAVVTSPGKLKNLVSKLFYKGFDKLFFFNTTLIELSIKTGKIKKEQAHLIHWGPDLEFYDYLRSEMPAQKNVFISTGRENRDFQTLVDAFTGEKSSLELYVPKVSIKNRYRERLGESSDLPSNIHLEYVSGIIPYELASKVAASSCVVICFHKPPYSYTLGLTTLVEAFALGKPVLSSLNPFWEMDIDKEGIGISLPYDDADSWRHAIQHIEKHPEIAVEMGKKGRELAEKSYNLALFTKELADILKSL
jgi:glycosyltransferase involved in cell wall biosynthesis